MLQIVFSLKNRAIAGLLVILSLSCKQTQKQQYIAPLPYYNEPSFTPHFITSTVSINQSITHTIASFSAVNQHNKIITQNSLKGKVHVANFIFTSCGSICPTMTNNFKQLQASFANNNQVAILSFSVTPWIDSVSVLKTYAERNNITCNNWHLLTASKSHIYQVARQQYFAEEDIGFTKDSTNFLHTEHAVLVDKSLRIRGIYNATLPLEIEQLVKDIQLLLQE